jgi:hypothetical protein
VNNEKSRSYKKNVNNTLFCAQFQCSRKPCALPFVITSPLGFLNLSNVPEPLILLNLLDVSDRGYYFAQSADGERLMITFEPVHSCVYYGLRGPPDILHNHNGILLCDYQTSQMLIF